MDTSAQKVFDRADIVRDVRLPAYRRNELQAIYEKFEAEIEKLDHRVDQQARERSGTQLVTTHPGVEPITALATEVFLGDPARSASSKALASNVGMISGERNQLGGLKDIQRHVVLHGANRAPGNDHLRHDDKIF